jgi:hypothetical protein
LRDRIATAPNWPKVGLYTSAAPTYFPSVDGYIDGGVYANNPSMCALTQSQDRRIRGRPALSDVALLSLGTGTSLVYIPDGLTGIADYQCHKILDKRYHRLAPVFPPGVSMPLDAVKRIPDMIQFAESLDLSDTVKWLRKHWMK